MPSADVMQLSSDDEWVDVEDEYGVEKLLDSDISTTTAALPHLVISEGGQLESPLEQIAPSVPAKKELPGQAEVRGAETSKTSSDISPQAPCTSDNSPQTTASDNLHQTATNDMSPPATTASDGSPAPKFAMPGTHAHREVTKVGDVGVSSFHADSKQAHATLRRFFNDLRARRPVDIEDLRQAFRDVSIATQKYGCLPKSS